MCDVLTAVGIDVFDQEQVEIILFGLPVEYDSVRAFTLAMDVSLEFLAKLLLDCESRKFDFVANVSMQANIVQKRENESSQFKENGFGFNIGGF